MKLKIPIVYGSIRHDRQGIKAAKFLVNQVKKRGHNAILVDPKALKLPLTDRMYKEYPKGKVPANIKKLESIFTNHDAVIVVTAEYNHLPPAPLKNLLDLFLEEYFFRPSAIVSYSAGPWGGTRAGSHSRDMLSEMGMPAIPSTLPIPSVQNQFSENGVPKDKDAWDKRTKKFLDELEWYAKAFKAQRKKGTPY